MSSTFNSYFTKAGGIKSFTIKIELYEYDEFTKDFVLSKSNSTLHVPSSIIDTSSNINYNRNSQVTRTLSLNIANHKVDEETRVALHNWGADYTKDNLKWWLDRRIKVYVCINGNDTQRGGYSKEEFENLDIVNLEDDTYYKSLGFFCVTNMSTSTGVGTFPVTNIRASSSEFLFTSKRGKFSEEVTIEKGAVITETIRSLLIRAGEKDSNICISTDAAMSSETIKYSDGKWRANTALNGRVQITTDKSTFKTGGDSEKITCSVGSNNSLPPNTVLASFTLNSGTINFDGMNALTFWCRSSLDLRDSQLVLRLIDVDPTIPNQIIKIGELAGDLLTYKVTQSSNTGAQTDYKYYTTENWRKIIAPLSITSRIKNIAKIQLETGLTLHKPLTFWIDDIVIADIGNTTYKDLNYSIGQNVWSAIEELAASIQCEAYYTKDGYFTFTKEKMVDPGENVQRIREYIKNSFSSSNPAYNNLNYLETPNGNDDQNGVIMFEPFYNYTKAADYTGIAYRGSVEAAVRLYIGGISGGLNQFLEPNTYSGRFIINLNNVSGAINKANLITMCTSSTYFHRGGMSVTWDYDIPNQIISCDILDLLAYNHTAVFTPSADEMERIGDIDFLFSSVGKAYSGILTIQKAGNYDKSSENVAVYLSDLTEEWREESEKGGSLYIKGTSAFSEGELANHTLVIGGAADAYIFSKAEMIMREPTYVPNDDGSYTLQQKGGILAKRRGAYLNDVGRVRGYNDYAISGWENNTLYKAVAYESDGRAYQQPDWISYYKEETFEYLQFKCIQEHLSSPDTHPVTGSLGANYWQLGEKGIWFNEDTNIAETYRYNPNLDSLKKIFGQDKFKHLEEQPYSNFTIEKIGDILYSYNNASPTPLIQYYWEALNNVLYELQERLTVNETFNFEMTPYFDLDVRDIIQVHDRHQGMFAKRFIVDSVNMSLKGGSFSVTGTSEYKPHLGIPYFDESQKHRSGPYFYGYDTIHDSCLHPFSQEEYNYTKQLTSTNPSQYNFHGYNTGEGNEINDKKNRRTYLVEAIKTNNININRYKTYIAANIEDYALVARYEGYIATLTHRIELQQQELDVLNILIDIYENSTDEEKESYIYSVNTGDKPAGYCTNYEGGINLDLDYFNLGQTYDFYDLAFFEGEMSISKDMVASAISITGTNYVTVNYLLADNLEPIAEPTIVENVSTYSAKAISLDGYILKNNSNQYDFNIENASNTSPTFNFYYEKQPVGIIKVRHKGVFGKEQVQLGSTITYENATVQSISAKAFDNFTLIGNTSSVVIKIQNDGEVIEYTFLYKPKYTWKITNNFHSLANEIGIVILNDDGEIVLDESNKVVLNNLQSFYYYDGTDVYFNYGNNMGKLTYYIYAKNNNIVQPPITMSITSNNYSNFFDPSKFLVIKKLTNLNPNFIQSEATPVCTIDFTSNNYGVCTSHL